MVQHVVAEVNSGRLNSRPRSASGSRGPSNSRPWQDFSGKRGRFRQACWGTARAQDLASVVVSPAVQRADDAPPVAVRLPAGSPGHGAGLAAQDQGPGGGGRRWRSARRRQRCAPARAPPSPRVAAPVAGLGHAFRGRRDGGLLEYGFLLAGEQLFVPARSRRRSGRPGSGAGGGGRRWRSARRRQRCAPARGRSSSRVAGGASRRLGHAFRGRRRWRIA